MPTIRRCVLLLSVPLLLVPAARAHWPGWRGPGGDNVAEGKNYPSHWSDTDNVLWKVSLEGAGVSAPVVWRDHIFLTASDGRHNDQLHVYAYHRRDGRQLWHTRLFGSAQPEGLFPPGGMAVPTPCTDGRQLFVLFGTGDLACLDFDGKPVWLRSLAQDYGPFRNRWGMGASPILVDGLVIVQVDHWSQSYLLAVDAATGATRWRTERSASVNWSTPAAASVNGKKLLITTGSQRVHGYDLDTGAELWSVIGLRDECIPTPVVRDDMVYAVSGRKGQTLAIRLDEKARGDITASHVVWRRTRGSPYTPSALCYRGYYFLGDDEGIGTCYDAVSGKELWRERLGGKYYRASPVAAAGKIYFTSMEGLVTVIEAGPEFKELARNRLGADIVATPAFSDGQIFIRTTEHLYCIGVK
ncbi:MAG: PQQ-binding-like beta-propeller repeat protein [Gemmataceae bacterium]